MWSRTQGEKSRKMPAKDHQDTFKVWKQITKIASVHITNGNHDSLPSFGRSSILQNGKIMPTVNDEVILRILALCWVNLVPFFCLSISNFIRFHKFTEQCFHWRYSFEIKEELKSPAFLTRGALAKQSNWLHR